jgi:hypothetical protein
MTRIRKYPEYEAFHNIAALIPLCRIEGKGPERHTRICYAVSRIPPRQRLLTGYLHALYYPYKYRRENPLPAKAA